MQKKKLVVLTGAGISAESGLKTFRDTDGLWMGHKVEDVATPGAFRKDPQRVLDFYNMRRREVSKAMPNAAHTGLVALEKYYEVTIVTQNIDDLHERAGSTRVLHLHGEIFKMCSTDDVHTLYDIRDDIQVGDRAADGSQLRPAIVWFEEPVPMIETAVRLMAEADIFLLVGTSLQVYPAAGLLHYVPLNVPKYILDKKIPAMTHVQNIHLIEQPATEGIKELLKLLTPNL